MEEKKFIDNYLRPSDGMLNRDFVHPLPPIEGLKNRGEFIVQGKLEDTFSTNIIYKYESESSGIRLVDVYKCTQHLKDGTFMRLVGTMSIVKSGYPFLFLDAAVSNINPFTQKREDVATRVLIHMPQADSGQRESVYGSLKKIIPNDIACKEITNPHMPEFWGPILFAESRKFDMGLIESLRNQAGSSYAALIDETEGKSTFDYMPVKEHMIFTSSKNEHLLFGKMGLTVPIEAQSAFFSVLTAGAVNPSL